MYLPIMRLRPSKTPLIATLAKSVKERLRLSYITNSPSSYQGEGDIGGEVVKQFFTICRSAFAFGYRLVALSRVLFD